LLDDVAPVARAVLADAVHEHHRVGVATPDAVEHHLAAPHRLVDALGARPRNADPVAGRAVLVVGRVRQQRARREHRDREQSLHDRRVYWISPYGPSTGSAAESQSLIETRPRGGDALIQYAEAAAIAWRAPQRDQQDPDRAAERHNRRITANPRPSEDARSAPAPIAHAGNVRNNEISGRTP